LAVPALAVAALAGGAGAEPARPPYLPPPVGTVTAEPTNRYELRREPGKGWVHEAGGFVARIAEDGTFRFEDKHVGVALALPLPLPLPPGTPTLEGTLRKLSPRARPRRPEPPPPPPPVEPIQRMSPYRPAPHDWCTYPHPCSFQARVLMIHGVGRFDLTDEIMRLGGQDPYRNQKAGFLASTAAFRQELTARAAKKARAQALEELRRRLEAIERDPTLRPAQRRAAMQALLDELDPNPAIAAPARALIESRLAGREDAGAP
jgi:hypothetical protein